MEREFIAENRWNRKRKLLPKLGHTYPSDLELRKVAELAEVDNPSIFGGHIHSIVLDAHLNDASWRNLSIPKVKKVLNKVMTKAQQLRNALQEIDVGAMASAEYAGRLLEYEMGISSIKERLVLIPECIQLLNLLNDAAHRAAQQAKSKRGPKGAGGNHAFNLFIQNLIMAAWQRRGHWTNYKSADGTWTGTLLKALKILKPYVPIGFYPAGELGRSIEHVRKKYKDSITKARLREQMPNSLTDTHRELSRPK
jgi:hypothetical protein